MIKKTTPPPAPPAEEDSTCLEGELNRNRWETGDRSALEGRKILLLASFSAS